MGKFAVIGLGNFGSNAAKTLFNLGHEVIALDKYEKRVNAAQSFSTVAVTGESTNKELLSSLQLPNMDAVFLSLGNHMSDSILTTLHLKDLGAKKIIVKIISEDHGRIVQKIGASEVVFPEKDMAVQVANYVSSPTIMTYLELSPEYSIQEIVPHKDFSGKTLAETRIRKDHGVNVIGIKDVLTESINLNPPANYVIKDSDLLIVIGHREDLKKMAAKK